MWEEATGRDERRGEAACAENLEEKKKRPLRKKERKGSPENLLLWAQILLCAALVGGVIAAKRLGLPVYGELRRAYTAVLQQDTALLSDDRDFARFAQQSLAELLGQAGEALAAMAPQQAAEPAGHRRSRAETAPAGCSLQSYQPPFEITVPIAGELRCNSPYGWRSDPLHGKTASQDFHTGVDLAAAQGGGVCAAAAGVVRAAAHQASYGNYVRILHAGGDETLYAHLQYLFVRPGQAVKAGEPLGTAGMTGNTTGPHLHFELFHQGVRYDPAAVLGL